MSCTSRASRVRSVSAAASAWAACDALSWARRSSARAWATRALACETRADRVKTPTANKNAAPTSSLTMFDTDSFPASCMARLAAAKMTRPVTNADHGGNRIPRASSATKTTR